MFVAFNPDGFDCVIESIEDPSKRAFLALCFCFSCDCAFEIDVEICSQISRLSREEFSNALAEFVRKNLIFSSNSRSAVYQELDHCLEGEKFSIPIVQGIPSSSLVSSLTVLP